MGYTHYFNFKKSPKAIENGADLFKAAVKATTDCIAQLPKKIPHEVREWNEKTGEYEVSRVGFLPFKLCGWDGNGEPEFTDTQVRFNGDAEMDFDHETCSIGYEDDTEFNFCKTARKPYDVAVCITLLCFKHYFGDNFEYSSDGDIEAGEEGWEKAKEITSKYFAQ